MTKWIEVKARYDKMQENGVVKKVTESYLVDALSCTEAEARAIDELRPLISGELSISSVSTTKISEIFWDESGDRYYKVKVNFITLDEKTGTEKRTASYILVQACDFRNALENFVDGMRGTMADFEIESISETKYIDVYKADLTPKQKAKNEVEKHVEKFVEACAERVVEKVEITATAGNKTGSVTIDISKPDDDGKADG